MAYGESNGHVIDDVVWPREVKFVTPIGLERNISKTAGDAILKKQQSLITTYCTVRQYGRPSLRQLGFLFYKSANIMYKNCKQ